MKLNKIRKGMLIELVTLLGDKLRGRVLECRDNSIVIMADRTRHAPKMKLNLSKSMLSSARQLMAL